MGYSSCKQLNQQLSWLVAGVGRHRCFFLVNSILKPLCRKPRCILRLQHFRGIFPFLSIKGQYRVTAFSIFPFWFSITSRPSFLRLSSPPPTVARRGMLDGVRRAASGLVQRQIEAPPGPMPAPWADGGTVVRARYTRSRLFGKRLGRVAWAPAPEHPSRTHVDVLVIGDSYADSIDMGFPCWPALVAGLRGSSCLCAARGGAAMADGIGQYEQASEFASAHGLALSADTWCIVHLGGNNLLHGLVCDAARARKSAAATRPAGDATPSRAATPQPCVLQARAAPRGGARLPCGLPPPLALRARAAAAALLSPHHFSLVRRGSGGGRWPSYSCCSTSRGC